MCLCLCLPVSVCLVWVGVCPSVLLGGEVAVKSVLFSPVGRICSLQICTACYCNRSHGCCSRCRRLQRRVRMWSQVSPPLCPSALPQQHLVPGAARRTGLFLMASVMPKAVALPPLTTVSLFVICNSLLLHFREDLRIFQSIVFRNRNLKFFSVLPIF